MSEEFKPCCWRIAERLKLWTKRELLEKHGIFITNDGTLKCPGKGSPKSSDGCFIGACLGIRGVVSHSHHESPLGYPCDHFLWQAQPEENKGLLSTHATIKNIHAGLAEI